MFQTTASMIFPGQVSRLQATRPPYSIVETASPSFMEANSSILVTLGSAKIDSLYETQMA